MSALPPRDRGTSVVTNSKGERSRRRLATGEILPVIGIYV